MSMQFTSHKKAEDFCLNFSVTKTLYLYEESSHAWRVTDKRPDKPHKEFPAQN